MQRRQGKSRSSREGITPYSMIQSLRTPRSFFFQAEDGIRCRDVTGVQTCALPIYAIDGNVVHITVSIGIALDTFAIATPDALVIQADLALYRAKQDGRSCYRFHTPELDRKSVV